MLWGSDRVTAVARVSSPQDGQSTCRGKREGEKAHVNSVPLSRSNAKK